MIDVGFAFDDKDFSDRILQLEVVPAAASSDYTSSDVKHKTLHISSVVLASYSPFFYKLFKNGMRDSKATVVNLEISSSEESAFMDLLNYMYKNTLDATSANDLVNVLIAADKFEVTCCMKYCVEMLLKLQMIQESALLYLEIPSSVMVSEIVKPLIDATKSYLAARYKDFTKSREEAMELPLSAVQVVLGSEGLRVISEDDVYDFILKWVRKHYLELEERREILTGHLVKLICFTNMSSSKMKDALTCSDFEHEQVSELVIKALFSKAELPFVGHVHVHNSKGIATTNEAFLGRIYTPHCFVYFDLKKDELKNLQPSDKVKSQTFCVGGKEFYLSAGRGLEKDHFALYVCSVVCSEICTVDCKVAVMDKSSKVFKSVCWYSKEFNSEVTSWGWYNPLGISWTEFTSDECKYFIDGVLHIRAAISVTKDS